MQRICLTRSISTQKPTIDTSNLDHATKSAGESPRPNKDMLRRIRNRRVPGKDPEVDHELGKQLKYEDDVQELGQK
jgi:hypothetical protein